MLNFSVENCVRKIYVDKIDGYEKRLLKLRRKINKKQKKTRLNFNFNKSIFSIFKNDTFSID